MVCVMGVACMQAHCQGVTFLQAQTFVGIGDCIRDTVQLYHGVWHGVTLICRMARF